MATQGGISVRAGVAFCIFFVSACSSAETDDGKPQHEPIVYPEGVSPTDEGLAFSTGDFVVSPGKERFLCFTKTLEQDAVIDRYFYDARPVIHHFLFVTTSGDEPDGFSECDVLFRPTWTPLFVASTADSKIDIPAGAANVVPAGSRLLIQLHLLNSSQADVTDRAVVQMRSSPLSDPEHAGIYAFGSTRVSLPPGPSTLTGNCTVQNDVQLFAMMAHMHYLGRSLRLEVGPSEAALETVYERNPYDFDNQELEPLPLTIPAGSFTRTTCNYDNPHDEVIGFGESSLTEMCFAIGFAVGVTRVGGCIQTGSGQEYPRDPAAGECADVVPNQLGIGAECTQGGGECASGLSCTADLRGTDTGTCVRQGCTDNADCGGGGATCCSTGFVDLCIAEACRSLTCAPK